MATREEKKAFALEQLKPYVKDPSLCGLDPVTKMCSYYSRNGKMCVAGRNMINPEQFKSVTKSIDVIMTDKQLILKPESRDILTNSEWQKLQGIHDCIAKGDKKSTDIFCRNLKLFTYEELIAD